MGQLCHRVGITGVNFFVNFTAPTNAGAIAILASLIVVPLVSLVTPKLPQKHVEDSFSCYDEEVKSKHKFALDEVSE